jgi:hypothetical protein
LASRGEARAIAAELLSAGGEPGSGDPAPDTAFRAAAGELVLAKIEVSEARFGAAFDRASAALFRLPAFGRLATADIHLFALVMETAAMLDRTPRIAERFIRAFVVPDPPRLFPGLYVPGRVASVCAQAPRAAAQRCLARLRPLVDAGFFRENLPHGDAEFLQGAEAYARGDHASSDEAPFTVTGVPSMRHCPVPSSQSTSGPGSSTGSVLVHAPRPAAPTARNKPARTRFVPGGGLPRRGLAEGPNGWRVSGERRAEGSQSLMVGAMKTSAVDVTINGKPTSRIDIGREVDSTRCLLGCSSMTSSNARG